MNVLLLRLYHFLLRFYPRQYQRQYGPQMTQTLSDLLEDTPTATGKLAIWIRVLAKDTPLTLTRQHALYLSSLGVQKPSPYVKQVTAWSTVLLVPFLLALIANYLDQLLRGSNLYHSWLWQMPVLAIWVLYLPIVSATSALLGIVFFELHKARSQQFEWRQLIVDIRFHWPLVVIGLVGLGIIAMVFGHDSVHCIIGNPIRELQQVFRTWQCIIAR